MKLKINQLQIIKINNQRYLPYQLHQLPKWFNKYYTNYFNKSGYTYISLSDHYINNKYFSFEKFKNTLSFNKDLNYKLKR